MNYFPSPSPSPITTNKKATSSTSCFLKYIISLFFFFFFFFWLRCLFKIQHVKDLFYQACLFLGSISAIILIIAHTFILNPVRSVLVVLTRIPSYLLIEYHRGLLTEPHAPEEEDQQPVSSESDNIPSALSSGTDNNIRTTIIQRNPAGLRTRIDETQSPRQQEYLEFLNYQRLVRRQQQRQQDQERAPLRTTTIATNTTTASYKPSMASSYVPHQSVVVPDSYWNTIVDEMDVGFQDLNAIIMNYLVVEGYDKAAQAFASESKTSLEQAGLGGPDEELLDLPPPPADPAVVSSLESSVAAELMDTTPAIFKSARDRMEIKSLIYWGEIERAIERINDIDPYFLDTYKDLHFELLRLELVELIRACNFPATLAAGNSTTAEVRPGDIEPALEFATNHLARRAMAAGKPEFLAELERTMALLCFPPQERLPAELAYLLDPNLRQRVADEVNTLLLEKQGIPGESKLANLMRLWAWSEKMMEQANIEVPIFDELDDAK
jgi:hypothetical protein